MSIDRQRIAAVKQLEALGYRFDAIEWKAPPGVAAAPTVFREADALHGLLILRADKLEGCTEGSLGDGIARDRRRSGCVRGEALAQRRGAGRKKGVRPRRDVQSLLP
jgi:hypothetical protein